MEMIVPTSLRDRIALNHNQTVVQTAPVWQQQHNQTVLSAR
jgi:hypothetical protein